MIGKTGNPNHTQTGGGAFYSVADTNELLKSAGGDSGGGGGDSGGGNIFVISANIGQGGTVTLDKTPNEVIDAINNGLRVEMHLTDSGLPNVWVLPLTEYNIYDVTYTCSIIYPRSLTEDGVPVLILGVSDSSAPDFDPYFYFKQTTIY